MCELDEFEDGPISIARGQQRLGRAGIYRADGRWECRSTGFAGQVGPIIMIGSGASVSEAYQSMVKVQARAEAQYG
jgi:hypothetical protein